MLLERPCRSREEDPMPGFYPHGGGEATAGGDQKLYFRLRPGRVCIIGNGRPAPLCEYVKR
jgi:hypothetical protein